MQPVDDLFAVIPAGGSGTRLWPLSRKDEPKFLHPLTGSSRSLLQSTFDRLTPLVAPDRIYVVTGATHAVAVARQLPEVPERNILVEPSPRDSAAAIAMACEVIGHRSPGAIVASFAADHLIRDPEAFRQTVLAAVDGARAGRLMTIGIAPTKPETGFGYLECGGQLAPFTASAVESFKEKPSLELATDYVDSGRYLWNASMFIWSAERFLAELDRLCPEVARPIAAIGAAWDSEDRDEVLSQLWPTVAKVAVDYAVMEPAAADGLVGTVPGDFGWSDIGDFESLAETLGRIDASATVVDAGPEAAPAPLILDSDGLIVVPASGRLIATLDVHDLIIVDTPDVVLISRRSRAQDVKKLTQALAERGADGYS